MPPNYLEEFKASVALYQNYLGLTLQTVTFALTVTSGVVAYVMKREGNPQQQAFALVLPAALCIGLGAGFIGQRTAAIALKMQLEVLTAKLGFGLAPHGSILVNAVTWLGLLMLVTGIVLLFVSVFQYRRPKSIEVKPG